VRKISSPQGIASVSNLCKGGGGATRPLPRDGGVEDSTETQQSGHSLRSRPEIKNGKIGAEDGAPKKLGCGTVKEEVSQILQRVSAGAA